MSGINYTFFGTFFGSANISVNVLDELKKAGYLPDLIVTYPDKPVGRGLKLSENPVAIWAHENQIPTIKEPKLTVDAVEKIKNKIADLRTNGTGPDNLFIVAAYGRIIPKTILDLSKHGTLNVHPSLLPKYRGPSPILSAILADETKNGVSIMLLDEEMDHGPVVAQEEVDITNLTTADSASVICRTGAWPMLYPEFEAYMGRKGGALLAKILPDWMAGKITAKDQDHTAATYTKKVNKEDGYIPYEVLKLANNSDSSGDANIAREIALKFSAYSGWPGIYTIYKSVGPNTKTNTDTNTKEIRLKITAADYDPKKRTFKVTKVIPEGKAETDASRFFN